jgi:hypothetical protein
MNFLKLLWSFVRNADLWLELFEKYNWVPEDDFSDNPMYSELAKKKTRTMWGD